ncbi:hypothetical protein QF027_008969 [Streptomyces canus]|nr:hypothetical protein [Streptomyces canus]
MISTRRVVAAVGLAVGVTGPAAPLANAADAGAPDAAQLSPIAVIDSLAVSDIPAEHKDEIPRVFEQLAALNQVKKLNELHQATDLVTPVTGLLPGVGGRVSRTDTEGRPDDRAALDACTCRGAADDSQPAVARNCAAASSAGCRPGRSRQRISGDGGARSHRGPCSRPGSPPA